jgi:hypothetical protein
MGLFRKSDDEKTDRYVPGSLEGRISQADMDVDRERPAALFSDAERETLRAHYIWHEDGCGC